MAVTFTRTGAQIEEIHNTVDDPKSNTQFSDDIRTIAGEYRGLWPDTGGSANKGDTYQTQVSGAPTGQYFAALQNTTVDPVSDDVNWRMVVSRSYVEYENQLQNSNINSNATGISLLDSRVSTNESDISALQDSQSSGVVVFQTFALLDAYTPINTTEEKGSFKVTNDPTSSLNGYYSWVSGTTYTKDNDLANGVVEVGNPDATSGGTVFDVTSAKADLIDSKNLLYTSDLTAGFLISAANGELVANASYSYVIFKIEPLTDYTYSIFTNLVNLQQYAFYDASMIFVSGTNGSASPHSFTTASNVHYAGLSIRNADLIYNYQFELGLSQTPYQAPQKVLPEAQVGNFANRDDTDLVLKIAGKNKVDQAGAVEGYYISANNGSEAPSAAYLATDFTEILPNTTYTFSKGGTSDQLQQFAYYDENKAYVSGVFPVGVKYTFTTPAGVAFARFSLKVSENIYEHQCEEGENVTAYEAYTTALPSKDIEKGGFSRDYLSASLRKDLDLKTIITVNQSGGADFTSLREAAESIGRTGYYNKIEIQLAPDTYDIMSMYSTAEINDVGFLGLIIPSDVSLKGMGGNKEDTVLAGELEGGFTTYPASTKLRVSTLAKFGSGDFENLTVTSKNLRYAVHDDYSQGFESRNVKDVDCIMYAGDNVTFNPWGAGAKEGDVQTFENCYMYSYQPLGYGFALHNNVNFTVPMSLKVKNCEFGSADGVWSFRVNSLQSTVRDKLELVGNKFNGKIRFDSTSAWDFDIKGHGNDVTPIEFAGVTSQATYQLDGETILIHNNGANILKGDAVKRSASGVEKMGVSDDVSLFYGVAFEDITTDGEGVVKIGGFIESTDTNLTGLVVGDKIGITSGELAVVTGSEYIGVYVITGFILIK